MSVEETRILEEGDVKPTSNRILVVRTLREATSPMSLIELETELETLDRSSIQRVLTLLAGKGLVHVMEDGRGVAKYELCHSAMQEGKDDNHVHFYCSRCNKVYCFENISIPDISIPSGFETTGVNFMLKGICPDCRKGES